MLIVIFALGFTGCDNSGGADTSFPVTETNLSYLHSALGGKSPDDRCLELSSLTPFWDEVEVNYHPEKERLQVQNYRDDLRLKKLKPCL